jgi:uncharacterized DUF497 family protein
LIGDEFLRHSKRLKISFKQTIKVFFIECSEVVFYNYEVIFEWNENKAKSNLRKHKVDFAEAQTIFSDPFVVTFTDESHSLDEERFISIGVSTVNRVLLVVHTEIVNSNNEISIRIISCRKATVLERKVYEEQF